MKQKVVIFNQDDLVIYEGKILDMPIKMDAIRMKSIALFNDPDPCIIHQSYAIHHLVTPLLQSLKKNEITKFSDLVIDLSWIDLPGIEQATIVWKG